MSNKLKNRQRDRELHKLRSIATKASRSAAGVATGIGVQLTTLTIEPGDIVVANTSAGFSRERANALIDTLKGRLPHGVQIVVLPAGVTLTAVQAESFAERIREMAWRPLAEAMVGVVELEYKPTGAESSQSDADVAFRDTARSGDEHFDHPPLPGH